MENIKKILREIGFEDKLIQEISQVGRLKKTKAESVAITGKSHDQEVPIVIDGLLKVMRVNDDGGEVFLYYLKKGETCVMSIICCLEGTKSAFNVVAEEDSFLWMIAIGNLDNWLIKYRSFRKFVFNSYQLRLDELLLVIDNVIFSKLDKRLYNYLLNTKQATGSYEINKTHEKIAKELGTSRVVISRLLKQLEKEGKIEQYRNRIEIL